MHLKNLPSLTTFKMSKSNRGEQTFGSILAAAVEVGTELKVPTLTTSERDALTATNGMVIYNTTTSKLQVYASSTWTDLH